MQPVLALVPLLVTLGLLLGWKRPPVASCAAGIGAAYLLTRVDHHFVLTTSSALTAVESAAYLGLSVVLVILPGLYLMHIIRAQGTVDGLAGWIDRQRMDPAAKLLFLLLGVLPAIEALTGFGVSLLLGVPVLLRLFDARRAHRLSLLGMNIMPWGTLALATLVGASLINQPASALGMASALTSAPVFPVLGLVSLHVLGGRGAVARFGWLALFMGLALPFCLFIAARWGMVEIAGVAAGLATTAAAALLLGATRRIELSGGREALRLVAPYLLVLALIVAARSVLSIWPGFSTGAVLRNARITFAPLISPGPWLLLAAVLLHLRSPAKIDHGALLRRAARPIAATLAFLVLAQVMREAGMVEAIAHAVAQLHGWVLWILVPAVGMLSGFATGSNVGGNVLFINLEYHVGVSRGEGLLYAAAHSSSAGHAVFTSLPIIMLVLAISAESHGIKGATVTPHELLRFAFGVALVLLVGLSLGLALLDQLDLTGRLG